MKTSKDTYYITRNTKFDVKALAIANAMALELLNYAIVVDSDLIKNVSYNNESVAKEFCNQILKDYTVGKLNPPLFSGWENRTRFTFEELVVQIFGYIFQISGNDLEDPDYMTTVLSKIKFSKTITVALASELEAFAKFEELVNVKVSLDKAAQQTLQKAALYFGSSLNGRKRIYSDEARIAVLLGLKDSIGLLDALSSLKCKPADVLRYSAALVNFGGVKLPSDVFYEKLSWKDRISLLTFLEGFSYDDLMEAMGLNREAWFRFFKHIHMFNQRDFINRFPTVGLSCRVSCGYVATLFPNRYESVFNALVSDNVIEILPSGNTVYRTFASRVTSAITEKNFSKIEKLLKKNSGYLLRNLAQVANGVTKPYEGAFVNLVRENLAHASADVMFSILGIDVNAEYRIIDVKGDTVIQDANYPKVIADIQGDIKREIHRRWGLDGKVIVEDGLENDGVPFLSKNANLVRGTRIPFESKLYLYFFMHWVQNDKVRSDLDHSYISITDEWKSEVIYFGEQANSYITHGGDITNAPAPNGATEYGMVRLDYIPENVRYIAPTINVFTGDVFSELTEAYAGFMFSDDKNFSITRDHVRYDLTNPAIFNIPFLIDVKNRELLIIDYNSRLLRGTTAFAEISDLKKIISATNTRNYISITNLAELLSGDSNKVSLEIRRKANKDNEIAVESLATLFNKH